MQDALRIEGQLADADPAPEVGLAFPRDVGQAVRSATELYRLDLAGRRAGSGGIWQSLAGSFAVGFGLPRKARS